MAPNPLNKRMKTSFFFRRYSIFLLTLIGGLVLVAGPIQLQAASDDLVAGALEIIGQRTHHDMVIVDEDQIIIADAMPANVGKKFDEDPNDEVGKTIADGKLRSFHEKGKDFPKGVHQIVYPVKNKDGDIVGALIISMSSLPKSKAKAK